MSRCSAGTGPVSSGRTVSSGHGTELRVSGMAQVAFFVIWWALTRSSKRRAISTKMLLERSFFLGGPCLRQDRAPRYNRLITTQQQCCMVRIFGASAPAGQRRTGSRANALPHTGGHCSDCVACAASVFLCAEARLSRTRACRSNHERALFGKCPDSVRIGFSKPVLFATLLCSKLDKNVAGPTERSQRRGFCWVGQVGTRFETPSLRAGSRRPIISWMTPRSMERRKKSKMSNPHQIAFYGKGASAKPPLPKQARRLGRTLARNLEWPAAAQMPATPALS